MLNLYTYITEKLHLNKDSKKPSSIRQQAWHVKTGDTVLMLKRVEDENNNITIVLELCTIDIIDGDSVTVKSKETGKIINIEFELENHQHSTSRISGSFAFGIYKIEGGKKYWAALMTPKRAIDRFNFSKSFNARSRKRREFDGYAVSKKQLDELGKDWAKKFISELSEGITEKLHLTKEKANSDD